MLVPVTVAAVTSELIKGAEKVVAALGRWPQFHDANVVNVERGETHLTVHIHAFNMSNSLDERGYFILNEHHLVQILMRGIQSSTLPVDYAADCLDGLYVEQHGAMVRVLFDSHLDCSGEVLCAEVLVESVRRCDGRGRPVVDAASEAGNSD